jgi:hypothetical protein
MSTIGELGAFLAREATAATRTPSSLEADTAITEAVPNGKPVRSTTA